MGSHLGRVQNGAGGFPPDPLPVGRATGCFVWVGEVLLETEARAGLVLVSASDGCERNEM